MTAIHWWESPAALAAYLTKAHVDAEALRDDTSAEIAVRYARAFGHLSGVLGTAIDTLRSNFYASVPAVPVEVVTGPVTSLPCGSVCADAPESCSTCVDARDPCSAPLATCLECGDCQPATKEAARAA
jgi:hypothetical protein